MNKNVYCNVILKSALYFVTKNTFTLFNIKSTIILAVSKASQYVLHLNNMVSSYLLIKHNSLFYIFI